MIKPNIGILVNSDSDILNYLNSKNFYYLFLNKNSNLIHFKKNYIKKITKLDFKNKINLDSLIKKFNLDFFIIYNSNIILNSDIKKNTNPDFLYIYSTADTKKIFRFIPFLNIENRIPDKKNLINYLIQNNYKISGLTLTQIKNNKETIICQKIFSLIQSETFDDIYKKYLTEEKYIFSNLINESINYLSDLNFKPLYFNQKIKLRYGENPHQQANLYILNKKNGGGFANFIKLFGKELSYNNIVDIDSVLNILEDFKDTNCVCIIKHNNPAGLATGRNDFEALRYAWQGDEVSAYGSIIGFSKKVNFDSATFLKNKFIEVVVAPDYADNALELLKTKKNLRIIKVKKFSDKKNLLLKTIEAGFIEQSKDAILFDYLKTVSKKKLKNISKNFIIFSIKAVKHLKSNAIALSFEYSKDYFCLVGKGVGQPNRVDCYDKLAKVSAIEFCKKFFNSDFKNFFNKIILSSDAFFPFDDIVKSACADGIKIFVQPGGSIRDNQVIETINKNNAAMILTGIRHFKH